MYYNKNELTIFYNQDHDYSKRTLALAYTLNTKVNKQEVHDCRISSSLFHYGLEKAGVSGKNLVNKSGDYYQNHLAGMDFNAEYWLQIIRNHPEIFTYPLALYKDKAIVCKTPTDVFKLNTV